MHKFLFFSIIFCTTLLVNIKAQEDDLGYLDLNKTIDWDDPVYNNFFTGTCSSKKSAMIRSLVKEYDQCDENWGSNHYGSITCESYKTICSKGCALTCMAMIMKDKGFDLDPGSLQTFMAPSGFYKCSVIWGAINDYPGNTGENNKIQFNNGRFKLNSDYKRLKTLIDVGGYAIAWVNSCTHFILIYDYTGNGTQASDFITSDPGISNANEYIGSRHMNFGDYVKCSGKDYNIVPYITSTNSPKTDFNVKDKTTNLDVDILQAIERYRSLMFHLKDEPLKSANYFCNQVWIITDPDGIKSTFTSESVDEYEFSKVGTYTVSVALQNAYGFDAEVKTIQVVDNGNNQGNPTPIVGQNVVLTCSYSPTSPTISTGNSIQMGFTVQPNIALINPKYTWTLTTSPGFNSSTIRTTTIGQLYYQYSQAGEYMVSVSVIDDNMNSGSYNFVFTIADVNKQIFPIIQLSPEPIANSYYVALNSCLRLWPMGYSNLSIGSTRYSYIGQAEWKLNGTIIKSVYYPFDMDCNCSNGDFTFTQLGVNTIELKENSWIDQSIKSTDYYNSVSKNVYAVDLNNVQYYTKGGTINNPASILVFDNSNSRNPVISSGETKNFVIYNKALLNTGFKAEAGSYFKMTPGQIYTQSCPTPTTCSFNTYPLLKSGELTSNLTLADTSLNSDNLSIYPNPNNGRFYIEFKGDISNVKYYKIYNSLGILVQSESNIVTEMNEINLGNVTPGFYFLQVEYSNHITIRKIILQNSK